MIRLIYLFIAFASGYTCLAQTSNTWAKIGPFEGGERERAVAFAVGGKGYVATGLDSADICRNDLWAFDPADGTWTQKASMPGAGRRNAVAFVLGEEAYVGTGADNVSAPAGNILNDFWKYDFRTNSWSAVAPFPGNNGQGIYFAAAFEADGRGFVVGGKRGPDSYTAELWEYKPSVNMWAQRADFGGGPRYQMSAISVNNQAFVGMGTDEDVYRKDWWGYNPGSNTWTQKIDFPGSVRATTVTFTVNDRGFVAMGTDGGFKKDVWEYVPADDSWITRRNFPAFGRKNAVAFVLDGGVFVGTGRSNTGMKRGFYRYQP